MISVDIIWFPPGFVTDHRHRPEEVVSPCLVITLFKSFPGINVSDRALPVVCEVKRSAVTGLDGEIRYDIFAQTDMIIYLTADGQLSTRI
eukprot:SAG22_NODE_606_length_8615_cov_6.190348_1_plen_90_part_00